MIQNETLIIRDYNTRSLDLDEIIENAKKQYAEMAARTREQADQWNKRKVQDNVLFSAFSELFIAHKCCLVSLPPVD